MAPRLWRHPSAPIFAVVFIAYAYFYQGGGWNQNVRFDLVRAIVEKRSFVIDDYLCATPHPPGERRHRNTGDESKRGDHFYCDKAPGVSWLGVPVYAVVHALHAGERSELHLATASYRVTIFALALPSALGVVALFTLLGVLQLRYRYRVLLSLGYGLGTLAWPYATLLYGHQLAAALLLGAFALLVRAKHDPQAKPHLFVVGLLLGYSVVCEYPAALGVIALAIYAAAFFRPYQRLLWLVGGGAVCALALAAYHWSAFGGPLTLPYEFSTEKDRSLGYFMGLGAPNWPAFSNTMFSTYRGLFYSAPWLLLGIPGVIALIRRKVFRAEAIVCASVFLLFVWMTSSLIGSWHGGWSLGPRYMVPAIPFLVIPIAGLLNEGPSRYHKAVAIVLALGIAGSAYLMLAGTAVRPEVPQKIDKPFTEYLLPHFHEGHLALNPQGIDRKELGGQGPHAWNMGHALGLRGLTSLVPLFALMAGGGVWLWAIGRQRDS